MTPFTSFLVLESDAAYMQQGIGRRTRYRFSDLEEKEKETTLAASDALVIPLGLMGCTEARSSAEPPMEAERVRMPADVPAAASGTSLSAPSPQPAVPSSEPGGGVRNKMEEGQMGKRDSARTGNRYAIKGPPGDKKMMPQEEAKEMARESGILQLLSDNTMPSSPFGADGDAIGGLGGIGKGGGGMGTGYGKNAKAPAKPRRKVDNDDPWDDEVSAIATAAPAVDEEKKSNLFVTAYCSDASKRPLAERRMLWARRLSMEPDASSYFSVFLTAGKSCELPTRRDRKTLLDLIDSRVHTADQVAALLSGFRAMPSMERYLRNRILRRAFDPDQLLGDSPGETYWPAFRAGLFAMKSVEEREKKLREFIKAHPNHVQAREMLVELFVQQKKTDAAEKEAVRIRRDGTATPRLLEMLCDLQADRKDVTAARRTCSELVEFNPNNASAMERLGDLFLRRGWYKEAYRQYTALVEMIQETPTALLRLAAAAAGMGKVDEALRIERKVASGDGEEGPNDPRRIAALHSAARLAALLLSAEAASNKSEKTAVERNLKRTQVFTEPVTLAFLIWEDFQSALTLNAKSGETPLVPSGIVTSPDTGLLVLDLGRDLPADAAFDVKQPTAAQGGAQGAALTRPVSYTLLIVTYDGKAFRIEEKRGTAQADRTIV